MSITENREKVKRKFKSLIDQRFSHLSVPKKKFILEMVMGIIITGSSNVSEIGRVLNESTELEYTTKRLRRMLMNAHLLEECNSLCLEEAAAKINSETILALDLGDVTHQYGEKMEGMKYVRDGSNSKKKTGLGYWLNQVSGYIPSTKETFPVLLDIFSTSEKEFKSTNNEALALVNQVIDKAGFDGLWVMDRDYDNGNILEPFLRRGLNFACRMKSNRNLIVGGSSVNISWAARKINRRVKYNSVCRFGSKKALLLQKNREYEVTLICFKDKRNKEPMMLLCNGWIKSTKELKRRIKGYFHRWGVEESYRFEKQGFGIEKCTLMRFSRIKTMLGLTLLSWILLIKINEAPKLKEEVLKHAKRLKRKRKQRPKFIYYSILKGVQNLFAGVEVLFRFRWKKEEKDKYREKLKAMRPLFPEIFMDVDWLEVAA